jgi:biopolymer transport protein ExbD
MACDDASVLNSQNEKFEYSRTLTSLAERIILKPNIYNSASMFIKQKSELFKRVKYQLEERDMYAFKKSFQYKYVLFFLIAILSTSWYFGEASAKLSNKGLGQFVVRIEVNADHEIFVNDKKTTRDNLKSKLEWVTQGQRESAIIDLRFDPDVTMQNVFYIQHTLQDLNILNVKYTNVAGKGLNLTLPPSLSADKIQKIDKKDILDIYLNGNKIYISNEREIRASSLEQYIRESLEKNEFLIINIHPDSQSHYQDFVKLLDEVYKAEAKRVLIQTAKNE